MQRHLDQGNIKGGGARCRQQNSQRGAALSNHCSQTKKKSNSLECGSPWVPGCEASILLPGPPGGKRETNSNRAMVLGDRPRCSSASPGMCLPWEGATHLALAVGGWEALLPTEQRAAARGTGSPAEGARWTPASSSPCGVGGVSIPIPLPCPGKLTKMEPVQQPPQSVPGAGGVIMKDSRRAGQRGGPCGTGQAGST